MFEDIKEEKRGAGNGASANQHLATAPRGCKVLVCAGTNTISSMRWRLNFLGRGSHLGDFVGGLGGLLGHDRRNQLLAW